MLTEQGTVREMVCSEAIPGSFENLTTPAFWQALTSLGSCAASDLHDTMAPDGSGEINDGLSSEEEAQAPIGAERASSDSPGQQHSPVTNVD
jgi:hypothetical protein